MKKCLVFLLALVALLNIPANADEVVRFQCDPPTHRALNSDCNTLGAQLTAEEIQSLEYTFSYRVKGSGAAWTNLVSPTPIAETTLPGYNVTYEVSVGARLPGQTAIMCASALVEYTTEPNTDPAGACTTLSITKRSE